jgi:cytochrome o ubiquinol oxidase operon protein cyoD
MTTQDGAPAHSHGQDVAHGHDDRHGDGASHGTYGSYLLGFGLSVVLTAIPFWLVMTHALPNQASGYIIMAFAAIQIVVHMILFLHMDNKSEGGWNMMALVFTLVVLIITLSGSLWVMYNMNTNMMPMSVEDMRQMP